MQAQRVIRGFVPSGSSAPCGRQSASNLPSFETDGYEESMSGSWREGQVLELPLKAGFPSAPLILTQHSTHHPSVSRKTSKKKHVEVLYGYATPEQKRAVSALINAENAAFEKALEQEIRFFGLRQKSSALLQEDDRMDPELTFPMEFDDLSSADNHAPLSPSSSMTMNDSTKKLKYSHPSSPLSSRHPHVPSSLWHHTQRQLATR